MRRPALLGLGLVVAAGLGLCFHKAQDAAGAAIHFDRDSGAVEVEGLDRAGVAKLARAGLSAADWGALLAVYPGREATPGDHLPPMLGRYGVERGRVRFTPRFPLVAGLDYTARFDAALFKARFGGGGPGAAPAVVATFALPKAVPAAATEVAAVYPSGGELPANQLRVYIHFSAPMSAGEAASRIHLFDAAGREVPRAFLRLDQELWDPGRERFTLLFDPGRIKRGLRANLDEGAPLKEGVSYCLVIDRAWRDGRGEPLGAGFEKRFTVTAADRAAPDHRAWRLEAPPAGSAEPVVLFFPEPLDHALLGELIEVRDGRGGRVSGRAEVSAGETAWRFVPSAAWRSGPYHLRVNPALEDRAGNSLRAVFDVDLRAQEADQQGPGQILIPFEVRSPTE